MNQKIEKMLNTIKTREHTKLRKAVEPIAFKKEESIPEHIAQFKKVVDMDPPILFENDDFGFSRGMDLRLPWGTGNITPNYHKIISQGFDAIIEQIKTNIGNTEDTSKKEFGEYMLQTIDICYGVADKYKAFAKDKGNERLYNALCNIPRNKATSFYEACVFIKFCIYCLRCSFMDHIGLGRFDQYMYEFYLADKQNGVSDDELFETLEGFFISLSFDSDLYTGMQQGDNGQSMVLGGFDKDGNSMYNEFSKLCMEASLELALIDPKINLRVGKNTPDEIYEFATLLTKQGLGFPQYCNDDVVVPGLVKLGYDLEDALNYTVAACWEFIIPNCGVDIPNAQLLNFPMVVNRAITNSLLECDSFDDLMVCVENEIRKECDLIVLATQDRVEKDRPFASIFMDGCIESLTDMWHGGTKYHNFGSHGIGIAPASDALASVKKNIFEDKIIGKAQLLDALRKSFREYEDMPEILKASPKMGNNDDYVDSIADELMDMYSRNLNNRPTGRGGIWRVGTGSAHEYFYQSRFCPATADGRMGGDPFPSSFSPSIDIKPSGLLSVIQSFTKHDMTNIINGGPLTIEIHDTVLRNDIGIKKTAQLVKSFILLGGHQLQLNSINRERLIDAQKHPENYPNLIVRVWGWSGYFNELELPFQNHIIRRCAYTE